MYRVVINEGDRTAVVPPDEQEETTEDGRGSVGDGELSDNIRWRDPHQDEYDAAFHLVRTLQDPGAPPIRDLVSYTDPPGRLRTSQALQGSAYRSLGVPDTSRPWIRDRKPRRSVHPIRLGILTDMSGSQIEMINLSSSLTWILSTAGRDEGVEVSSLLFGDAVVAVAYPGSTIPGVPEPITLSKTEEFGQACDALESYLDLGDESCRRVVIIFSDGDFTPGESARRDDQIARWGRQGVHVLWVSDTPDCYGIAAEYLWTKTVPDARLDVIRTALELMEERTDG